MCNHSEKWSCDNKRKDRVEPASSMLNVAKKKKKDIERSKCTFLNRHNTWTKCKKVLLWYRVFL